MKHQMLSIAMSFDQSQSQPFDLFMILFESPFKIKLNFYAYNDVAITFLTYLFKYVENLNRLNLSHDPKDRDWASCPLNVSESSCDLTIIEENGCCLGRSIDLLLLQTPKNIVKRDLV